MKTDFSFPNQRQCICIFVNNEHYRDPDLKLDGVAIPVTDEVKFLGLTADANLSFIPNIQNLKRRCLKALNLLRIVMHTDWGADSVTLLRLYRSHLRFMLDYGCVVYGSVRPSYLALPDLVKYAALRVCLGAFQTSPIPSLRDAFESGVRETLSTIHFEAEV
jgi:hypothetical protein